MQYYTFLSKKLHDKAINIALLNSTAMEIYTVSLCKFKYKIRWQTADSELKHLAKIQQKQL